MSDNKRYISQEKENGAIHVSEDVISTIAAVAAAEVQGVAGLSAGEQSGPLNRKNVTRSVTLEETDGVLTVNLSLLVNFGAAISEVAQAVQAAVMNGVEATTGLKVAAVNVNICGVVMEKA